MLRQLIQYENVSVQKCRNQFLENKPERGTLFFAANDLAQSSAFSGSAAKILISGFRDLAAIQTPLINPPPPTGATMASRLDT